MNKIDNLKIDYAPMFSGLFGEKCNEYLNACFSDGFIRYSANHGMDKKCIKHLVNDWIIQTLLNETHKKTYFANENS